MCVHAWPEQVIHETIDSDIDFSKKGATTWKKLEKSDALSEFLKNHCKLGTYKMTIMKCADPQCKYHLRRRLSEKEWEDLTISRYRARS